MHNCHKLAFHDTDTDILTDILARMSVSVSASWNAGFTQHDTDNLPS